MRSLLFAVLVFCGPASFLKAHDLEWKNLLIASLKLRQGFDYDANVDSYMEAFRHDVWNRYRNDEFEMVGKRKETIELMKQAIANFSLQETFVIRTTTGFGNYDFASKSFPVDGWSERSYYSDSYYPHGGFPGNIRVFFSNPRVVSRIMLDEAKAKEFVRNRTDRNGNVDRRLYVILQLRIVKAKAEPGELLSEITSCKIYADDRYTKLIHEVDVAPKAPATKDTTVVPLTAQKANP